MKDDKPSQSPKLDSRSCLYSYVGNTAPQSRYTTGQEDTIGDEENYVDSLDVGDHQLGGEELHAGAGEIVGGKRLCVVKLERVTVRAEDELKEICDGIDITSNMRDNANHQMEEEEDKTEQANTNY